MNFQVIAAILQVLKDEGIVENPEKAFQCETKFFEGDKTHPPQWHYGVYFASEEMKSMLNCLADELKLNRIWQDPQYDTPIQGYPPTPCVGDGVKIVIDESLEIKKILEEHLRERLEKPVEHIKKYIAFGNKLVSAITTALP